MVKKCWSALILAGLASALIMACATPGTAPPPFDAQPIPDGMHQQKVDHLYFIMDASSSMLEGHAGQTKFDIAQSVIRNFNKTMPSVNTKVALRTFGHDDGVTEKMSAMMAEPTTYNPDALTKGLDMVSKAGGISPLNRALKDAGNDLGGAQAPIAMVIVSDGKDMEANTVGAAEALKEAHGDQLCIYTVQVGNHGDGAKLLGEIAEVTGCGKAANADSLTSGGAMNAFVKEVVLSELADSDGDGVTDDKDRCPNTPRGVPVDSDGCPLDSDGDGVTDDKDKCPDTPKGVKVDADGCPLPVASKSAEVTDAGTWIYKDIKFEINKADLKASSYPVLDEIVGALNAQPGLNIEIQGHTDSTGEHGYNVGLSEKRAKSVITYLESKGIDGSRMTSKGYGPDRPIAPNKTRDGRARNRRVEIKPLK